jgi:hypothetical protein
VITNPGNIRTQILVMLVDTDFSSVMSYFFIKGQIICHSEPAKAGKARRAPRRIHPKHR